jgi:hypothetical protein
MMFDPFANQGSRKNVVGRAYVTPDQVAMGGIDNDTTPMSSHIPSGYFNGKSVGKGTVIPHHKPGRGGGSLGYNPHKPPHKNVIIDPHVVGRAVALDLGKIRPEDSAAAFQTGMEFANEVMEDPPEMMDEIKMKVEEGPRLGAYAAARLLAENYGARPDDAFTQFGSRLGMQTFQAAPGGQLFDRGNGPTAHAKVYTVPPATTGQAQAAAFGVPTVGQPPAPVHVIQGGQQAIMPVPAPPASGPMARFRPVPVPTPPAVAPAVHAEAQQASGPPRVKVTFDFGAPMGQFPSQYHDVITTVGGLILVWDTRWPYGEPYSPENTTHQFAIQVAGDPKTHLVMSVSNTFTFEYLGFRFYHLGIVESRSADEG